MVIFHSYVAVYQRVHPFSYWCVAKRRVAGWVAGGMGLLLIVIMDDSRKFPAFSTSKKMSPLPLFNIETCLKEDVNSLRKP